MKRENRYLVLKLTDIINSLSLADQLELTRLACLIDTGRELSGRSELECVVVESDWPEYDPTWAAIEARVDAETPVEIDNKHYCSDGYWWEITRGSSSLFIEIGKNSQILEHECFLSENSAYKQKNKWLTKYGMFCPE